MPLEEVIKRLAGKSLPQNEEMAKFQFIAPILSELGWDVYNSNDRNEVEYERPVGPGRGVANKGRADIALMKVTRVGSECACLIEAKAPQQKLEDHVDQLVGYAFHEGVDLCILTNAKEWWLYLPREKGPIHERRFAELNLNDSPEEFAAELEQFLGRDNVRSGASVRLASQRLKALKDAGILTSELPKVWGQMLNEPDQDLVELVSRRVVKRIGLSPTPNQVAAVIAGKSLQTGSLTRNLLVANSTQEEERGEAAIAKSRTRRVVKNVPRRPTAFTLWGETYPVETSKDILVKLCEVLWRRDPSRFGQLGELWGNRKQITSRSTAGHIRSARIADSGYWVETTHSADAVQSICSKLLEFFGYSGDELHTSWKDPE